MSTPIRNAVTAAIAFALVSSTALAAPTAKQYQSSLTDSPVGSGATIKITKPSKVIVKSTTGNIAITLKLAGVTDALDQPVNLANNTLKVDFIRGTNGMSNTATFGFNIVNGKLSQTFQLTDGAIPGGPMGAGDTITIRGIQLEQNGVGANFAVAGITLK